jgi:hypothetical protein
VRRRGKGRVGRGLGLTTVGTTMVNLLRPLSKDIFEPVMGEIFREKGDE